MKSLFRGFVAAFFCFVFAVIAFADDFKSMVIQGDSGFTATPLPHIQGDQFMVIRNFTQEASASSMRGTVTVTKPPGGMSVKVLAAAILDPSVSPEVINSVVIAGPADVSVTCGAATGNCFISYKKDSN